MFDYRYIYFYYLLLILILFIVYKLFFKLLKRSKNRRKTIFSRPLFTEWVVGRQPYCLSSWPAAVSALSVCSWPALQLRQSAPELQVNKFIFFSLYDFLDRAKRLGVREWPFPPSQEVERWAQRLPSGKTRGRGGQSPSTASEGALGAAPQS